MFNLTLNYRLWQAGKTFCYTAKDKITPLNRLILLSGCLVFFSSDIRANYAPIIQNPNSGYLIQLGNNSSIATTPEQGSDGRYYYQVGSPIVVNGNSSSVSVTGAVKCVGRTWGNSSTNIGGDNVFHRLFITVPPAETTINGRMGYRINSNVVMTVDSKMSNWVGIWAAICANASSTTTALPSDFVAQFPFTLTFYINDRIIDGQVVIASMDLGGYVRAFMDPRVAPSYNSWPISETSVPMRLASSQLNVGSSCTTTTSTGQAGTVNLRHGQLNSLNYDSVITEKVNYICKFALSTNVRLRLDYATDGDSQKRLPMINSLDNTKKIYSELKMTDESTGQSGTDFKVNIKDLKTITISSHIQGTNATAGDYRGSAWLIATFD